MAEASWTKVQQRDLTVQYNPLDKAALQALAPQFPWADFLAGASLGDRDRFIATTNTALPKLATIVAAAPLGTVKEWMAFRVADTAAPYLSAPFGDAFFQFREKTHRGPGRAAPAMEARAGRGGGHGLRRRLDLPRNAQLGRLAQLYSERHFPAATKASMNALIR